MPGSAFHFPRSFRCLMHTLAVPLLLFAVGDEPVKPLLPVGKDTTVVSGPVDKHGHIDYEAALNERLGKGVKP